MKKNFLTFIIFLLWATHGFSANKGTNPLFVFSVHGNYLIARDANFREVYGGFKFNPEIKAACKVDTSFYIWAGYSNLTATGTTPELQLEAKSRQHFYSIGVDYWRRISSSINLRLGIGLLMVSFREEAMGEEVSDSTVGFRLDGGVILNISRRFFSEILAGFLSASSNMENEISIKVGGFKMGIALGVKF